MLEKMVDSYLVYYMLGALGVVGLFSRGVRSIALKKLLVAAGNMAKSNHSFIRLVKSKYEHACMISDRVENTEVFVDKYVHEYKACGLMFHTWRRCERVVLALEILLVLFGVGSTYMIHGYTTAAVDMITSYVTMGGLICGVLILFQQMSDETYRVKALRMYMVDYLENVYAHRFAKNNAREREYRENHLAEIQVPAAVQPQAVQATSPNVTLVKESEPPKTTPLIIPEAPVPEIINPGEQTPEVPALPKTSTDLPISTPKNPIVEEPEPPREDVIREILAEFLA